MKKNITGILYAHLKYLKQKIFNSDRYKLTKRIIQYLQSDECTLPIADKQAFKKYFSENLAYMYAYPFVSEYMHRYVNVLWDKTKSLHYVLHNEKKLYFKKGLSKSEVRNMYNVLCIEQDTRSPHSYFSFPIVYHSMDIAVDIGSAEGIWALDIIEKVNEIYLFECDEDWIEALQATFEPFKNKIHIVNKYVVDFTDEQHTTLDDYFCKKHIFPTIIKADIEGAEMDCLNGASTLLNQHIHHFLLCTYHKVDDFVIFSEIMKNHHFETQVSDGYLICIYESPNYSCKDVATIFRKGVIYASKMRLNSKELND